MKTGTVPGRTAMRRQEPLLTFWKRKALSFIHSAWFPYAVLAVLAWAVYANGMKAPFTLDDFSSIEDNPAIQDLKNIGAIWNFYTNRFLLYLSIAVNYAIHGTSLSGYHIVNISLHAINGMLVFRLLSTLLRLPVLNRALPQRHILWIALPGAALFICHPMQVNAVTYIIQRTTALAAAFSLLSLLFYLYFRLRDRNLYFMFCLVFMLFAMFTKENTIILPVLIAFMEFLLSRGFRKITTGKLITVFILLILFLPVIPASNLVLNGYNQSDPNSTFKASTSLNRLHYFYTQQNVIVTYIRQWFVPDNLCFDYSNHFSISKTLWENNAWLSMLVLILLGISAVFGLFYNKWISLGIGWFFIGLSVESSFISIKDVYFEHRMYFPMIGLCMVLIGLFFGWKHSVFQNRENVTGSGRKSLNAYGLLLGIMILAFTPVTIYRNYLFTDPVLLWSDVVKKAPGSSRGHSVLATSYLNKYEFEGEDPEYLTYAEKSFLESVRLDPKNDTSLCNLAKVYLLWGKLDACIETAKQALSVRKSVYAYHHLGQAYRKQGKYSLAAETLLKGYELDKKCSFILEALGDTYYDAGNMELAVKYYQEFLEYYIGDHVQERVDLLSSTVSDQIQ
ncbi:MAG TPA: hypothetical protein DD727_04220 [Clostridiales bacterium]|nr:hypothetical protein [Clostridiales bacterium]